jgi:hypothetical protein
VTGTDVLGARGEEREVFLKPGASEAATTTLHVLGPNTARPDAEIRAEAFLVTCDQRLVPPARIDVSGINFKISKFTPFHIPN